MAKTFLDEVFGFWPDFIEHYLAHAVHDPTVTSACSNPVTDSEKVIVTSKGPQLRTGCNRPVIIA